MLYSGNNNNYYSYYKNDDEEDNNIVQYIDPNETTITKEYPSQFKNTVEIIAIPSTVASIDNNALTEMTELKAVIIDPDRDAKQESYDNRGNCKNNGTKYKYYSDYTFTHGEESESITVVSWSEAIKNMGVGEGCKTYTNSTLSIPYGDDIE